jgi:hypothetical protein
MKLAQQRRRDTEKKRAARAAARAAQEATAANGSNGADGNGAHHGAKAEAVRLWRHAAKLDARSPWKPVADDFRAQ